MSSFLQKFQTEYEPKLGRRAPTFRCLFEALSNRWHLTIVETGCLRQPDNWAGDGQSTLMFQQLAETTHLSFYSVDLSPDSVAAARKIVPNCNVIQSDSIKFLSSFKLPIDVLYLDSLDYDPHNPFRSSKHHLLELCAAQRNLRSGSYVVVDDTWRVSGRVFGKGGLVAEYMQAVDATLLATGYQDVWRLS